MCVLKSTIEISSKIPKITSTVTNLNIRSSFSRIPQHSCLTLLFLFLSLSFLILIFSLAFLSFIFPYRKILKAFYIFLFHLNLLFLFIYLFYILFHFSYSVNYLFTKQTRNYILFLGGYKRIWSK